MSRDGLSLSWFAPMTVAKDYVSQSSASSFVAPVLSTMRNRDLWSVPARMAMGSTAMPTGRQLLVSTSASLHQAVMHVQHSCSPDSSSETFYMLDAVVQ